MFRKETHTGLEADGEYMMTEFSILGELSLYFTFRFFLEVNISKEWHSLPSNLHCFACTICRWLETTRLTEENNLRKIMCMLLCPSGPISQPSPL